MHPREKHLCPSGLLAAYWAQVHSQSPAEVSHTPGASEAAGERSLLHLPVVGALPEPSLMGEFLVLWFDQ